MIPYVLFLVISETRTTIVRESIWVAMICGYATVAVRVLGNFPGIGNFPGTLTLDGRDDSFGGVVLFPCQYFAVHGVVSQTVVSPVSELH